MLYRPLPPQCAHWGTFPKGEGFVPLNSPLAAVGDGLRTSRCYAAILAPRWKTGKRGVEDAAPYADIFPFIRLTYPAHKHTSKNRRLFPKGGDLYYCFPVSSG